MKRIKDSQIINHTTNTNAQIFHCLIYNFTIVIKTILWWSTLLRWPKVRSQIEIGFWLISQIWVTLDKNTHIWTDNFYKGDEIMIYSSESLLQILLWILDNLVMKCNAQFTTHTWHNPSKSDSEPWNQLKTIEYIKDLSVTMFQYFDLRSKINYLLPLAKETKTTK